MCRRGDKGISGQGIRWRCDLAWQGSLSHLDVDVAVDVGGGEAEDAHVRFVRLVGLLLVLPVLLKSKRKACHEPLHYLPRLRHALDNARTARFTTSCPLLLRRATMRGRRPRRSWAGCRGDERSVGGALQKRHPSIYPRNTHRLPREEDVDVAALLLPPAVGAADHHLEAPRLEGLGHLGEKELRKWESRERERERVKVSPCTLANRSTEERGERRGDMTRHLPPARTPRPAPPPRGGCAPSGRRRI